MREIKFRAFDTYTNRIVSWEEIKESCELDSFFDLVSFEKMQFTGIKDRNGVDIYEGDIIADFEYQAGYEPMIAKVIFDNGSFKTEEGVFTEMLIEFEGSCEVIGNIYQNPELLEASK